MKTGVVWENEALEAEAVCPNTGGKHVLSRAVGCAYDTNDSEGGRAIIVDVWCEHCGRSGSVTVEVKDVLW